MTTIALGHTAARPAASHRAETAQASRTATRTRLTRRGRVVLAALIVLPLLVGGAAFAASGAAMAGSEASSSSFRHLTVQPGDSLWSIAEEVAPRSDPRDVVAAFIDLNGLSSSLVQAGQQLAVPHEFDRSGK